MAYTIAQLESYIAQLEGALARGEQSVTFADRSASYRSVDAILKAIAYFQKLLNELNARPKQTLAVAAKGF